MRSFVHNLLKLSIIDGLDGLELDLLLLSLAFQVFVVTDDSTERSIDHEELRVGVFFIVGLAVQLIVEPTVAGLVALLIADGAVETQQ